MCAYLWYLHTCGGQRETLSTLSLNLELGVSTAPESMAAATHLLAFYIGARDLNPDARAHVGSALIHGAILQPRW